MNDGTVFRLPDQRDCVPSFYPQSFHNDFIDDDDSDSDIRTVKTNTSLTHGFPGDDLLLFPEVALVTTNISDEDDADDEQEAVFRFFKNRSVRNKNPSKKSESNVKRKGEEAVWSSKPPTFTALSVASSPMEYHPPPIVTPSSVQSKESMMDYHYLTDERIAMANVGPPIHKSSRTDDAEIPTKTEASRMQENDSDDSSSTSPNEDIEFIDFNPVNETLVEPMLLNMSGDEYSSQEYMEDESSYSYSLAGRGDASPSGSSFADEENSKPRAQVVPDYCNPYKSANAEKAVQAFSTPGLPANTIVNNDGAANDSNWIKSSWSYLQMMARMASISPSPPKRDTPRIVDLDDTVSYVSTTNNTYNNDILSVNGGDEQRSFDSTLFRGKVAISGHLPDDTSTLPSAESGDCSDIPSSSPVVRPSLTDPVQILHGRTGSTFVVAYGSSEDDDSFPAQNTATKASLKVLNLDAGTLEDNETSQKAQKTPLYRRKRLCRWLFVLFMLLVLTFAATELICTFGWSCPRHLGYLKIHPESSLRSAIPPPPFVNTTTTKVPTVAPIVRPTRPPTPVKKPKGPTGSSIVPTLAPVVEPITTAPFPMLVDDVLVLNTTQALYDAVDLYVAALLSENNAATGLPPIGEWDVSRIINMTSVFSSHRNPAMKFFQVGNDLNSWNVTNVRYMRYMFLQAESFNGNLSSWDVSKVIDMHQTFASAYQFNQDISMWNVSSVQLMAEMFKNCPQFNQNIGSWDTRNVFSMQGLFHNAITFNQNLFWNTGKVQDMSEMFEDADAFNGDVSTFNTSSVTNMRKMFRHAASFTAINGLWSWQTSNVVDTSEMFLGAISFSGDGLSTWTMSSLQTANLMFAGAKLFNQDLCGNWNAVLLQLDGTRNMFAGTSCPNEDTADPIFPDRSNTFCVACTPPITSTFPPTTTGSAMVGRNPFLSSQELRDAVDAYAVDDTASSIVAFRYGYPIGVWDVSRITDFSQIFDAKRNTNLLNFEADLGGWNVSNAISMYAMFQQTVSFQDLNNGLSRWDVRKVTDMSGMFASSAFSGDISQWQVQSVADFSFFAEFAANFRSDVSLWNVSAAQDMGWMFRAAKAFQSNVSGWDVSQVLDFTNMFAGATSFNQNLCSWGLHVENATTLEISFRSMFAATSCPLAALEPNGTTSGPWCTPC